MKKNLIAVAVALTTMAGAATTALADTTNTTSSGNVTVTVSGNTTGNVAGNTTNATGGTTQSSFPASYLYFVTQITQSISIALADNNVDKAKLLVQYGIDNIQQANQLIKEGNVDAANALLTNALSYQNSAVDTSQQAGSTTATEIKGEVAGNIVALATALQQVQNPTAQAQLEKNILKDLQHLQKRIGKIHEDADTEDSQTTVNTDGTANTDTNNTTATNTTSSQTTVSAGHKSKGEHKKHEGEHEDGSFNVTTNTQGTVDLSNLFSGNQDQQGEGDGHGDDHGDH